MQVGDIVKIEDWKGSAPDKRKHGKVLRIAGQHRWSSNQIFNTRSEGLAEILWQDGATGWVSASRLGKVSIS